MTWPFSPLSGLFGSLSGTVAPDGPSSSVDPAAPAWWYSPERHGSPRQFARSTDFDRFRARVRAIVTQLTRLERGDSRGPANEGPFKILERRLTTVDRTGDNLAFGDHAAVMYGTAAEYLERIATLAAADDLPVDLRQAELGKLGDVITACSPGALGALETAIEGLDPKRVELTGRCHAAMEDIIEQTAVQAVERDYEDYLDLTPGNQVHLVATLNRQLHAALGRPWRRTEDRWGPVALAPATVNDCLGKLRERLRPADVAATLAQDYLTRFSDAMDQHLRRSARPPVPTLNDIQECATQLRPEFGAAPPASALLCPAADPRAYRLTTDPTLIALDFLEQLRLAKCFTGEDLSPPARSWSIDDASMPRTSRTTVHHREPLAWVEEDGQRRPVTMDDLTRLPREAITTSMMAVAVRNSPADQPSQAAAELWLSAGRPTLGAAPGWRALLDGTPDELRAGEDLLTDIRAARQFQTLRSLTGRATPGRLVARLTGRDADGTSRLGRYLASGAIGQRDRVLEALTAANRDGTLPIGRLLRALGGRAGDDQCLPAQMVRWQPHARARFLAFLLEALEQGRTTPTELSEALLGIDDSAREGDRPSWMHRLDTQRKHQVAIDIFNALCSHHWHASTSGDARALLTRLSDGMLVSQCLHEDFSSMTKAAEVSADFVIALVGGQPLPSLLELVRRPIERD